MSSIVLTRRGRLVRSVLLLVVLVAAIAAAVYVGTHPMFAATGHVSDAAWCQAMHTAEACIGR